MPIWVAIAFHRRMEEQPQTIEGPEIPARLILDSRRNNLSWDAWLGATKEEATQKALTGRFNYGEPGRTNYSIIVGEITEILQEQARPNDPPPGVNELARAIRELPWNRNVFDAPITPRRRAPQFVIDDADDPDF